MATRFATATGVWSNNGIWDGGTLPTSSDTVHPNGFTVTIDTDISVASLNNNISPVYLPGMPIPAMTGNTQPSGTVIAGSDTSNAWKGFDQDAPTPTTFWAGTGVGSGTAWIGYNFTAAKIIKRYYIYRVSQNPKPTSWTFDGSNDGSTWITLETVTANALNTPYLSGVLANTTAYLYYRINVTAVTSGTIANIYQFEMTESTATTYGATTGGSFLVPSSLSGTRNIVFSGDGIRANSTTALVLLSNLIGSTVNVNVTAGGYITNVNWLQASGNFIKGFEINGTGTINFNSSIYGNTNAFQTDSGGAIHVNGAATITINGNLFAGIGASKNDLIFFKATTSNNSTLNLNGNIIASGNNASYNPIQIEGNPIINIVGNLSGNLGTCINYFGTPSPIISVTGNIDVANSNSNPAINLLTKNALLTINGSITNRGNVNPIMSYKIRFAATATPYWIYQTNGASDITLAYGAATGAYPVEADVRFGTTYAASPTRTGTLRVPLPQYVSQGVLTDNTTGTAYLSAADVWNIQTSTLTTAGSIGERLKTASTVQTNGDQLASYIV